MIKYIGVSGLARTGKNIFCDIAIKQLKEQFNINAKSYALAHELKKDCADFVKDKLGLNVFSEDTSEKTIFRPLLVWYADIKRKQTNGRYWIELLDNTIKNDINDNNIDVVLISDIRFAEYPKDEIFWLKNELNGKLIHIKKWYFNHNYNEKTYDVPPNDHEARNDPKLQKNADYLIEWEGINQDNLINNEYLNKKVKNCLNFILQ